MTAKKTVLALGVHVEWLSASDGTPGLHRVWCCWSLWGKGLFSQGQTTTAISLTPLGVHPHATSYTK